MRLEVRFFGFPVFSVELKEFNREDYSIGGGATHDFAIAEQFVDERFLPWDDDEAVVKLGFH